MALVQQFSLLAALAIGCCCLTEGAPDQRLCIDSRLGRSLSTQAPTSNQEDTVMFSETPIEYQTGVTLTKSDPISLLLEEVANLDLTPSIGRGSLQSTGTGAIFARKREISEKIDSNTSEPPQTLPSTTTGKSEPVKPNGSRSYVAATSGYGKFCCRIRLISQKEDPTADSNRKQSTTTTETAITSSSQEPSTEQSFDEYKLRRVQMILESLSKAQAVK